MQRLVDYIKKIPNWTYIITSYYIISRLIFGSIGILAQNGDLNIKTPNQFKDSKNIWLNIWDKWDTNNYIVISKYGYIKGSRGQEIHYYAFFPAYPVAIYLVDKIVDNTFLSGWIISNISLIIASFVLYKLARIDFDERYSLRIVKYLYLLPMAFIFSAILSESLFLLLLLLSIYMARKKKWILAGIFGALLSLTRPHGILIVIVFIIEYLESINYRIKLAKLTSIIGVILPATGTILFCVFSYLTVGDSLAFIHAQRLWGHSFANPMFFIIINLYHGAYKNALYSLIIICVLFFSLNKIRFSYWLLSFLMLIVPLSIGVSSIPRYTAVIFPLAYILARISYNKFNNITLTLLLIAFQVYLFIAWQMGSFFTM